MGWGAAKATEIMLAPEGGGEEERRQEGAPPPQTRAQLDRVKDRLIRRHLQRDRQTRPQADILTPTGGEAATQRQAGDPHPAVRHTHIRQQTAREQCPREREAATQLCRQRHTSAEA